MHPTAATREVGGTAASNVDLVAAVDVVIPAWPFDVVAGFVREVGDGLNGKVLIDVTNRFTGDRARTFEGIGTLNISLNMKDGAAWRSGWKLVGPVP